MILKVISEYRWEEGQRRRLALWAAHLPLPLTDAAQVSLAPARAPAPSHSDSPPPLTAASPAAGLALTDLPA